MMNIRFRGLHTIDAGESLLRPGHGTLGLVDAVSSVLGGMGHQKVMGQDVFIGFHQSRRQDPYQESVFIATGEGSRLADEVLEAKLSSLLNKLGVPKEKRQYLQHYSRQDHRGVFGNSSEFDTFHQEGPTVGMMVEKNRLALFRPNGELALYPRKMDKNVTFVSDGSRSDKGNFYVFWQPYIEGVRNFLTRYGQGGNSAGSPTEDD